MKKQIFILGFLGLNIAAFAQWSPTPPGGTVPLYQGGGHLVYSSGVGVLNWGNGGANDDLYLRSLSSISNINSYTDRIRIKYNGWTTFWGGSGTNATNPSDQIHVFPSSGANGITITNSSTTSRAAITLENSSSSKKYSIGTTGTSDMHGGGRFVIRDVSTGLDHFVMQPNGNIRIGGGTLVAKHKLDVNGNISIIGNNQLLYDNPDAFVSWGTAYTGNMSFRSLNIQGNLTAGYKDVMILTGDGRVGIGTIAPSASAKLNVNGNVLIGDPAVVNNLPAGYKLYVQTGIITEKVKVQLVQWADYVFEKDYKLKSLEEVSSFIKENKHLPGVPSTEEIKADGGLDVAQMDAKLMEKIEELTLYIIQLNEKNTELSKRLTELEKVK